MKRIAAAFTGPSNSGKTTLIEKVSMYLNQEGFKVCIVKHDPKDKAVFDTVGKDSHKFFQTGADVAVMSPNRTTMFKQESASIDTVIQMFGDFDYLLVEGLKTLPLPRIAVFRNELNENYFEVTDAIATDDTIQSEFIPRNCEHLNLNDIQNILQWINDNGKKV